VSKQDAAILMAYIKTNIHTFALISEDEDKYKTQEEKELDKDFELNKDMYIHSFSSMITISKKIQEVVPGSHEEEQLIADLYAINIPGITDTNNVKHTPIDVEHPLTDTVEDAGLPLSHSPEFIDTPEYREEKSKLIMELLIQRSPHLTEKQRNEGHATLCTVMNCISIRGENMKTTTAATYEINTGNNSPFKEKLRPQTEYAEKVIDRELTKMLKAGVIKPSTSPYATNLLVVSKPDPSETTGIKDRVCVAYVKLNNQTIKDTYPVPLIQQIFYKVCRSKWFTTMDLMSGFWQVSVKPEHRHKTAFITSRGLYEFLVMPFGLCNAPSTFQRLMDKVIKPEYRKFVESYIDDIIIHSNTWEEHLEQVEKVLQLFIDHDLTVKLSKCNFFQAVVRFLGHLITHNSLKINPAITEVVKKWQKPITNNRKQYIKAIRSFLGTVGWYRKFIPHFSDLARPLHDLTKVDAKLEWTEVHQHAFEQLRDALINAPVLLAPDSSKDYLLHTDASKFAIGAILQQQDKDNNYRPVAYYSRTLNPAQRNYSPTDREALALVESCEHFKQLLQGHKYVACTDHNALTYIYKNQDTTPRLTRYFLRLSPFELTVQYKKGKDNIAADLLSRHQEYMVSNNGVRKEEYEVEKIVDRRRIEGTRDEYEYKVKWKGYPSSDNTWEPLQHLQNSLELVIKYNKRIDAALKRLQLISKDEENTKNELAFPSIGTNAAQEWKCIKCDIVYSTFTDYSVHNLKQHNASVDYKDIVPEVLQMDTPAMREQQRNDPEFTFIFDYLKDNSVYNKLTSIQKNIITTNEFVLDGNGLLYNIDVPSTRSLAPSRTHLRLCLPSTYRNKFVSYVHSNILSGHAGISHTYDKLRTHVWWHKMMQTIMYVLSQCPVCLRTKQEQKITPNHPTMIPTYPWQMVSVDIVGPLPITSGGNKYILTMQDCYSKYAECEAISDATTATVADSFMKTIICRHGVPEIMTSDQGVQFVSAIANSLFKSLRIRRITTTAYHPQANMVERYNKTLKSVLHAWVSELQGDWDVLLPYARFAYNTEYHSIIRETPHYVIHARDARTAIDDITRTNTQQNTSVHEYVNVINERMHVVHERIKNIYQKINQQREEELLTTNKLRKYKVGDSVYVYDPKTPVGLSRKLIRRWSGPYIITRIKSAVDYEVVKDNKVKVIHVNRIKLAGEYNDDHTEIDVYKQTLIATEIELQRLENSIQALVYEKATKQKEYEALTTNYQTTGDRLVNNIYDDDDENINIYDYKNQFISHQHLQKHQLKWKPKQQTSSQQNDTQRNENIDNNHARLYYTNNGTLSNKPVTQITDSKTQSVSYNSDIKVSNQGKKDKHNNVLMKDNATDGIKHNIVTIYHPRIPSFK